LASQDTDRIAGKSKGVSAEPIILRVYSPDVLPLTLVDTPGIARVCQAPTTQASLRQSPNALCIRQVPVGDQPSNIEQQIRNMVLSHIKQKVSACTTHPLRSSHPNNSPNQSVVLKNAIILAVQAANQDIATSDALKLASEVDPEGVRTVGVMTKLDLMDRGTNAMDILAGRAFSLRLGFIGVVNRSQEDINNNKPIHRSLEAEEQFFADHPLYHRLADRSGSRFLATRCNQVQDTRALRLVDGVVMRRCTLHAYLLTHHCMFNLIALDLAYS
jgi:dynamin 1-like protein